MNFLNYFKVILKPIVITVVFTFLVPLIGKSQAGNYEYGFIVKNNNDTVHGLIKSRNLNPYFYSYTEIKFKTDEKANVEIFTPDSVKAYIVGDNWFVTKYLSQKKKNFFYEVIVEGYVTFYELKLRSFQNDVFFAILKKQNEENELSFEEINVLYPFKKRMMEFFKDAPALCNKIRNGIYTQMDIEKIVREYNKLHQ
jgi:hypothetical protein